MKPNLILSSVKFDLTRKAIQNGHFSQQSTALLSPPHFYQVCHVRKISCHQYSGCKKYQKEKRKIFFNLALLSPPHSYYTADMRLKIMIQPNLAFSPVKFDLTRKENKKRQFSQQLSALLSPPHFYYSADNLDSTKANFVICEILSDKKGKSKWKFFSIAECFIVSAAFLLHC